MIHAIITSNSAKDVLNGIQDYIQKHGTIGGVRVAEHTDKQIVILLGESPIDQQQAEVWWSGYSSGLKSALE